MSYMEKKTHKRQTTIVTLSDQNTKEIQDIRDQKEKMLAAYEEKKAKLRAIMLEKEAALSKTKQELDDLAEYKVWKADESVFDQPLVFSLILLLLKVTLNSCKAMLAAMS